MSLQYSFYPLDDLDGRSTLRCHTAFECFNTRHRPPAPVSTYSMALPLAGSLFIKERLTSPVALSRPPSSSQNLGNTISIVARTTNIFLRIPLPRVFRDIYIACLEGENYLIRTTVAQVTS